MHTHDKCDSSPSCKLESPISHCGNLDSYHTVPVTALLYSLCWAMANTVHWWLSSDVLEGILAKGFGKGGQILIQRKSVFTFHNIDIFFTFENKM